MILIKKYLLFALNLIIIASLCFVSQGTALAQSPAQAAEEDVFTPLFPDLEWRLSENIQKDVQVYGRTSVFTGDLFAAVASFPDKNPESIFEYYSSENLQSFGWDFVGGVGVELVYRHVSETFLTVTIEKCFNSETDYCIDVWKSTKFIGMPNMIEPDTVPSPLLIGYNKTTPANGSTVTMPDLANTYMLLQWTDALIDDTDRYQYCVDETNNNSCDSSWITKNALYSGGPGEFALVSGRTYYWQVKTRDTNVYANGGTWWSFTVKKTSYSFNKTTPVNGSTIAMPATTYQLLQWTDAGLPSTDRYQYCIDETNNNSCDDDNWVTRDSLYSGGPNDFVLLRGHTYYWQVKARDANIFANSGTWWSFKIANYSFNKTLPVNGSTIPLPATTYQLLQWTDAALLATDRYQYCIDETNNNSCDTTWITRDSLYSGGPGEFTVNYGHKYYWQVRARDANVYADSGTWWSFTIEPILAPPSVTTINRSVPPGPLTNAASVVFSVTFSQAVTGVDISDFTLTTTGVVGASITSVSGTDNTATRTVTVNAGSGDGTIRLNIIDDDTIKNSQTTPLGGIGVGNGSFTTGQTYTFERTPPIVSSIVISNTLTSNIVAYRVTFSEDVTGVDASDFVIATTGTLSGVTVSSVSGSGSVYTISVYVGSGASGNSGNLRLDLIDNDTIKDAATNSLGGAGAGNGSFTTAPAFTIWSGGVSVTSDKNIVTVARPHIGAEVASYDGFSSGANTAFVPMLFKDAFGGSYDAALYIQNVSGSSASITLEYFDSSGTLNCTKADTISALASKGYWLPSVTCDSGSLPTGWVGGVKVTSDQPIVAVGRPHIGAEVMSYNGFSAGSTFAFIPMLFKGAFGGSYNAAYYIQNVSSSSASITLEYFDNTGALNCAKADTLAPLASKGYWLPSATCDSGSLPAGWVGGVRVTSDQPIVSVGRPHIDTQITTYDGFSGGSVSSYVPMLFKGAFGGSYNAAYYIQNVSNSSANVTIKYYDNVGTLNCTKSDTIAPLASKGYWVPSVTCDSGSLPAGWVGGVEVTSDQSVVSVGRPHIDTQVTTYNGFSSGATSAFLPMLFKDAFGGSYDSALYIQNLEASVATVEIKMYDSVGTLICTQNPTVGGNSTIGIWFPSLTCP